MDRIVQRLEGWDEEANKDIWQKSILGEENSVCAWHVCEARKEVARAEWVKEKELSDLQEKFLLQHMCMYGVCKVIYNSK
jgi:hypothetical protein